MAGGGIQFVADTSQFNAPLAEASKAALNVAASAEEARQRIVTAYQAQVKAAQDAGASQTQLTAITNRASSQFASVTEDNARRYINAIDRMEDRTRRFNAARSTLSSVTASQPESNFSLGGYAGEADQARELATAVSGVNAAHAAGVSPGVQFGSVIRGLEGNFSRNVRAAEAFGSTLGFLTPVIAAAFPVVGALTLGYALVEMGKHAYEAWQNIVNLRSAIEGLNQLQIRVDSDSNRFAQDQENSVESILNHTANRSTSLQQRYSFQSNQPLDLSSYFYSDQFKKLPDDVKGTFEQTYKNIAPSDAQSRIQSITKTVNDLQAAVAGVKNGSIGAFLPVINGSGPSSTRNPLSYYTAQLTAAQQIQSELVGATGTRSANLQATQTDISAAQQDEAKQASDKAAAARRQQAQQFRQNLEANGVAVRQQSQYQSDIDKYTSGYTNDFFKSNGLSSGDSKSLDDQGKSANDYIQSLRESLDLQRENASALASSGNQMALAAGQITKLDAAQVTANQHTQDYQRALQELNEQRDYISTSHEYDLLPVARQAALQDNTNRVNALNANRQIQVGQDNQATNPQGSSGVVGVIDALNDFVASVRNASTQMRQFTDSALTGLNRNAVNGLFGQRTNFRGLGLDLARQGTGALLSRTEGGILSSLGFGGNPNGTQSNPLYVRIANGVGGVTGSGLSSIGSSLSKIPGVGSFGSALLKIPILGGLFGGAAGPGLDGLDLAQGIAQGAGDISPISSTLTSLLPGLAIGGNADANSSYIVGERGPEILTMGTQPGRVISNGQIGATTNHYYNVDATGATDPSAIHDAVRRAIPAAVSASSQVQHQRSIRRPQR